MNTDVSSPIDVAVMELLTAAHPALLSRGEVHQALSADYSAPEVDDALRRFTGLGLVHELQGFVWVTRTYLAADEVSGALGGHIAREIRRAP